MAELSGESEDTTLAGDSLGDDPRAGSAAADMLGRAALHARLGLTREPTAIGRYEIAERLGQGGMGTVFAARDSELDRHVALKLLNDRRVTREGRARLVREARSLAKLSHPNIVHVYEAGELDDMPYLAMELVPGGTLREWLDGVDDRVEILGMFLAIGEGLAAAHAAGIVHRDFKPDNVLVGEDGRPRIADFGLAALERTPAVTVDETGESRDRDGDQPISLTRTGAVMGTPAYMAPEQWLGLPTDARSDQFAYCVALHEALYGVRPFTASTVDGLRARVLEAELEPVAPAARVPAKLHAAILRGLAADPDERWPDLATLLSAIHEVIALAQPGMFVSSPLPIVTLIAPLMLLIPVLWVCLELAGVVAYAARSWLFVSTAQLLLVVCVVFPMRHRVLSRMANPRMIALPIVTLPLLLAHRILALATGGSIELMFAYDFLTIAAIAGAVVILVERGLWPMVVLCLTLAIVAGARLAWAPHLWLVFSLTAPVVVGTTGARALRRRSQGALYSPTEALWSSQPRSGSRWAAPKKKSNKD